MTEGPATLQDTLRLRIKTIDWKATLAVAARSARAYTGGVLKVLVPTWVWSLFCGLVVSPIVMLSIGAVLALGKGAGHGAGAAFILVPALPGLLVALVFLLGFPFGHWMISQRSGLLSVLRQLLSEEKLPVIFWGVDAVIRGVEKVAPGVLTGAVAFDARFVQSAYSAIDAAESVPRLIRRVLVWAFKKIDLPRILALEMTAAQGVEASVLAERISVVVEERIRKILKFSWKAPILLGLGQLALAGALDALAWYLVSGSDQWWALPSPRH